MENWGVAECLIDVVNVQDLRLLLPYIRKHRIPWFIIGKGSNLLVPDKKLARNHITPEWRF
ncbi:MAG: hypothetical protein CM1200mP28_13990 [Deltaproteobacteria bacterium]|nr:MAG: hypothetical protein CM1200mP28_13990 [Deltaproteobacteria bacterium]